MFGATRSTAPSASSTRRSSLTSARVGVVGATGAVGRVTVGLLRERGYDAVSLFASARSAGTEVDGIRVDEATPETLAAGGGDVVVDKSSAYRLEPRIPLVVPEVNGARAFEHDGVLANPNCCTIPLTCVLKPLHEAAGLERVRVATYQSVSGAGASAMQRLRDEPQDEHDLRMDWDFDGEEFDEEAKLRAETRKIMELPDLPVSATCV